MAEENTFYFDVLQKALPQEEGKSAEEGSREKTTATSQDDSLLNPDQRGGKVSPKVTAGTKNTQKTQSSSGSRHTRGGSVNRSQDQKVSANSKPPSTQDNPKENSVHGGATPGPVANGDIVRPSSAGKIHLPSGKKQAAVVKAVPRSDPPSPSSSPQLPAAEAEAKDKVIG